ncbi:hypothetical protein EC973_008152 [Apophysomyces ossiformis]|uniref:Uncharacterized protein n=1 Tax=Apophysomyces ossiformis TaxID=679940 RepID=A0A8H7BSV1_9FUNG|nr:hypothetical protein EC973_008152 [Apophysomyces ossiformis]
MDPNDGDNVLLRRTDSVMEDRSVSPTAPWLTLEPPTLSRSFSESHIQTPLKKSIHDHQEPPGLSCSRPNSLVELSYRSGLDTHASNKDQRRPPPPPLPLARFDQSTVTGSSEPLIDEIAACVSEWNSLLYTYLEENRYAAFNVVRDHINYLFQARRQLLDQALSKEELSRLRKEIIHRMMIVNLSLNREMVIRHPERGYILDANSTSLAMLYRMHWKYATSEQPPIDSFLSAPTPSMPSPRLSIAASSPPLSQNSSLADLPSPAASQENGTSAGSIPPQKGAKFYHLFFELKACLAYICQPGEFTELHFSLYNKAEGKFITEEFVVTLNYNGMPKDESQIGKLQTLFADLSVHDLNEHLYLVCRIIRLGGMKFMDKEKDHLGAIGSHASMIFGSGEAHRMMSYFDHGSSRHHVQQHQQQQGKQQPMPTSNANLCRRPFGCAVLHLGNIVQKLDQHVSAVTGSVTTPGLFSPGASTTAPGGHTALSEHDMRIYIPTSESTFATLHEDIINNNVKEFAKHSKAEMLCVYLRMFYGWLDEVLKTNAALLQGVPRTSRLGFPDVVFPDDERNELYITLCSGDFAQFGRSRNIQVTMCVRDNITGDIVENALTAGSGAPYITYWDSMIFYHDQRPKWGEMLKLKINDHRLWQRSHIFMTIRHRSSHSTSLASNTNNSPPMMKLSGEGLSPPAPSSSEKIIAMGFLPLTLPPVHRDFTADGSHVLYLYKYDRQLANPSVYLDNVAWCYRSSTPANMQNNSPREQRPKIGYHYSSSNNSVKSSNGNFSTTSIFNPAGTHVSSATVNASEATIVPWTVDISTTSSGNATGKLSTIRDSITIKTFLCSTRFTQNKTLVKLLNWKTMLDDGTITGEDLLSILDKFTFVGEMEVVKFLCDIFDVLLDILVCRHKSIEAHDALVDQTLAAIICVLGIVQDRRFSNFRPVLDVYIDQRFSVEEANKQSENSKTRNLYGVKEEMTYEQMLKGMLRLCTNPSDSKKAKRLRSSMKVWDYIFRFIVRSREMQKHNEEDGERSLRDIMFKEELQQLVSLITHMMSPDQPSAMIGTQTLALQHFAEILSELRAVFSPKQVVDLASNFMDACSHVTGKLVGFKLCTILAIVKGPVFNDQTCRSGLAKNVFKWIRVWLNSYMEAAKDIIFARHNDQHDTDHHQTRLPKVQWLENLRLSLTIMSEILGKVRKSCGMSSSGLSTSSISSPSIYTISRPISMATNGDEDTIDETHMELRSITEIALQLVPQLMHAYKDLQRLTVQAVQASGMPNNSGDPIFSAARPASRHSITMLRERTHSVNVKHSPSMPADISDAGSRFAVVLQSLATAPTIPFPSSYPFQSTASKINLTSTAEGHTAAMVTTGLLDLTIVILELFYLTPRQQWVEFLQNMYEREGVDETAIFLRKICHMCTAILFGDSTQMLDESSAKIDGLERCEEDETREFRKLPDAWLNVNVIAHQIVLCNILAPAASIFELDAFIPNTQFDHAEEEDSTTDSPLVCLWRTFFVSLLRALSSSRLEIENFLPQAQRAIWKLVGNIKGVVGAKTLLTLWHLAGPRHTRADAVRKLELLSYFGMKTNNSSTVEPISEEHEHFPAEVEKGKERSILDDDPEMYAVKIMIDKLNSDGGETEELHVIPDMSESASDVVSDMPNISMLQIDLIPILLRPLCSVALTLHDKARSAALSVIADVISVELHTFGELTRVQHLLIATLDRLVMSENKGNEAIRCRLVVELAHTLERKLCLQNANSLVDSGVKAVHSLGQFMELLLQIRSLPLDNDEFMDERINATLKLMKFIQMIEREEIYIKYVHQLVQLHVESHNYVEAALTLRFHADLLQWDPHEKLDAILELDFPAESSFARKEKLYWTMISYLDEGNAWEKSIKLCKELAHQYETTTFDYVKLSKTLQHEAHLVQDIVKKERYFAEYFRVGFYGRGFPASVRNQQFIYRGLEWEKMASFVERMQNRHPNAQLLSGKVATASLIYEDQLKEMETALDGQYLQITPVVPEPDNEAGVDFRNPLMPENVRKYYESNEVSRFSFSRPISRTQASDEDHKPESDFLNLWTEKTIFICEDAFPTIARRSKILHVQIAELSPIENAVMAIENKNQELIVLEKKYAAYLDEKQTRSDMGAININPFSMALNGAVDAPVNGGVPLYKKAFLTQEYWDANPDMHPWIERLRKGIDDQVKVIDHCLETHNKLVSPEMRPFHNTLVGFYKKNFPEEIKRLSQAHDTQEDTHGYRSPVHNASERPNLLRQDSIMQLPPIGTASPMSPVSRAFSIRSPVTEQSLMRAAVENTSMSRAESISRSLKMSLGKKSRKKSQRGS